MTEQAPKPPDGVKVDVFVRVRGDGYEMWGDGFNGGVRRLVWNDVAELQAMGFRGTVKIEGWLNEQRPKETVSKSKLLQAVELANAGKDWTAVYK